MYNGVYNFTASARIYICILYKYIITRGTAAGVDSFERPRHWWRLKYFLSTKKIVRQFARARVAALSLAFWTAPFAWGLLRFFRSFRPRRQSFVCTDKKKVFKNNPMSVWETAWAKKKRKMCETKTKNFAGGYALWWCNETFFLNKKNKRKTL